MAGGRLPAGWTLEKVREVSGDGRAAALGADRVVRWVGGSGGDERLHPETILGFDRLCLVQPVGDEDWYMGSLNDDGSVDCWSAYGDLYEALRGL
ncbi:hypothetical protein QC281_34030 [Streptomyces sp. DH17]|nr:hypothetical protein [Streptomyces sp. DH17]